MLEPLNRKLKPLALLLIFVFVSQVIFPTVVTASHLSSMGAVALINYHPEGNGLAFTSTTLLADSVDFSSLTPEQKKAYFMKKKDAFKPTPDAIAEKVSQGMKMKGAAMPPGVSEKISAKMKGKEGFIPTPEAISKKISDGMKMAKSKLAEMVDD